MKGATRTCNDNVQNVFISIHAPNEGSDMEITGIRGIAEIFQSTLPMKGATHGRINIVSKTPFQSTLPMKGATLYITFTKYITIFQSTLPMKGATAI